MFVSKHSPDGAFLSSGIRQMEISLFKAFSRWSLFVPMHSLDGMRKQGKVCFASLVVSRHSRVWIRNPHGTIFKIRRCVIEAGLVDDPDDWCQDELRIRNETWFDGANVSDVRWLVGDDKIEDVTGVSSCGRFLKLFELQSLDHIEESRIDGELEMASDPDALRSPHMSRWSVVDADTVEMRNDVMEGIRHKKCRSICLTAMTIVMRGYTRCD